MIARRGADVGRREARTQGAFRSAATWARPRTKHHGVQRRTAAWPFIAMGALGAIALLLAGPAAAHVVATPAYLPKGSTESITFSGPNERDAPMTGFALTVPDGLEIRHAHVVEGWNESVEGSTATWLGGPLAPGQELAFGMTLEAEVEPGVVELDAEQRYPDGSVVRWPIDLTITPARESPSQNLALAGVVALIGVLSIVAVAMLAWRRRA